MNLTLTEYLLIATTALLTYNLIKQNESNKKRKFNRIVRQINIYLAKPNSREYKYLLFDKLDKLGSCVVTHKQLKQANTLKWKVVDL